jgi:hypothetical protein
MDNLQESLDWINAALAQIRERRPSMKASYDRGPALPLDEIERFERKHNCSLPREYRQFLLQVGKGGEFDLEQHFPGSGYEFCLSDDVDLSIPFPHSEGWNTTWEGEEYDPDDPYFSPRHVDGSLIIDDSGCSSWKRLIVTGPLAGEIWDDRRIDGQGVFPILAPDGTHQTFLRRVLDFVDLELYCLGWPGKRRQAPTYPGPSRRKLPLVDG